MESLTIKPDAVSDIESQVTIGFSDKSGESPEAYFQASLMLTLRYSSSI